MGAAKRIVEDVCYDHRDGISISEIARKYSISEDDCKCILDEYYSDMMSD